MSTLAHLLDRGQQAGAVRTDTDAHDLKTLLVGCQAMHHPGRVRKSTLDPPMILICPALSSTTWPRIESVGQMCVNLLSDGQEKLARQFAKSGGDKYDGVAWTPSPATGSPVLDGVLAWIDCQVHRAHPGGDHRIVVARALDLETRTHGRPLIFFQGGFQRML